MLPTTNIDGTVREIYKISEQKSNPQRQMMIFDMYVFKPYWDNSKEQRKTFYVKVLLNGSVNSHKWDYIKKGTKLVFSATNFSIVDYNGKQTFTLSANLNNVDILDSFSSGSDNNNYDNNYKNQNNNQNNNNYNNYNNQNNNIINQDQNNLSEKNNDVPEDDSWVNNMNNNFQEDPFSSVENDIEEDKVSMPAKSDDTYLKEVEDVIGNPYS